RLVAAHVEDLVEDLDVHRADLVAGPAGGAGEELIGGDALEEAVRGELDPRYQRDRWAHHRIATGGGDLPHLEHDLPGVEGLAGGVGRTHRSAATTHGAGVGVEDLLPREFRHHRCPERLEVGLHQVRHRLHRPL